MLALVNGRKIYFEESGTGPPLLLIPGLGGNPGTYARVRPALSQRYRVLIPDLSWLGRSEQAPGPPTVAGWAADMYEFLRTVAAQPAVVVGHSLGAMVAKVLAAEHPEAVSALIVAGARPDRPADTARAAIAREKGMAALLAETGATHFAHKGGQMPAEIVQLRTEALLAMNAADFAAVSEIVFSTRPYLPRIQCPTLILVAEHDKSANLEVNRVLAQGIRKSELMLLSGLAHLIPLEDPDRFVQAVLGFLARHGL